MPTPCRAPPRRAAPLRCAAPLSTASLIAPPQSAPPPLVSPLPAEARPAQPHTTLSAALLCFAPRSPSPPSDAPRPCLVTGCGWSAPGARGRLITGWLRVREGARAAGYTPLRTATLVCTAPHHAPLLCAAPRRPTPLSAVSCLAPPLPASHLRPSRSPGPSAAPHLAAPCRPRPTIPACPCGARFTQPPLRRRIRSAHLTFPPAQPRRTPLCRNAPARSPPLPCSLVPSSSRLAFRSLPSPSPPLPPPRPTPPALPGSPRLVPPCRSQLHTVLHTPLLNAPRRTAPLHSARVRRTLRHTAPLLMHPCSPRPASLRPSLHRIPALPPPPPRPISPLPAAHAPTLLVCPCGARPAQPHPSPQLRGAASHIATPLFTTAPLSAPPHLLQPHFRGPRPRPKAVVPPLPPPLPLARPVPSRRAAQLSPPPRSLARPPPSCSLARTLTLPTP